MPLTSSDVIRIARLARIQISPEEAAQTLAQLTGVLCLIEQLQAVDTTGVEPMSHARDATLRLRDDVVTEADRHTVFQAIAPQVEAGLYLVPQVLE